MSEPTDSEVLSRRLDLATRVARIAVWEWDTATDRLYWSPVFKEMLGLSDEAFGGRLSDFLDRLVPEDQERVQQALRVHIDRGLPYDIQYEMFHSSGRRVAVAATGRMSKGDDGGPGRMVGTVQDITDRRSLEQRLLESERIAHIGHWSVDLSTGQLTWSPETFRIHGLSPTDPTPTVEEAFALYHPEDVPIVAAAFESLVQGGSFKEVDARIRWRDGEIRHVHVTGGAALAADGSPQRVFGVTHDRTEFVKKERQLERAQRAEVFGQLAGGVAHDFNNLMSVMLGNLELLKEMAADRLRDEEHELIGDVVQAITRGRDLTSSLLSFARSAALRPERVEPGRLFGSLQGMLRRTLPATIELIVEAPAGQQGVYADVGHLEACLVNLVINARDAIGSQGRITLSCFEATLDPGESAEAGSDAVPHLCFRVEDDGTGIPESDLRRVFEPFFTTKPRGRGSGLGLSRVKGFAEQSGGRVRIDSQPGRGTRVDLLLPVSDAPRIHARAETGPATPVDPSCLTILLAEDLGPVRRVLSSTLQRMGHRVIDAASGDLALVAFRSAEHIDLVVSDLVMPGQLQGPDLVREIRRIRPDMPAIFLSGYAREFAEQEYGVAVSDECLMKPIRAADLAQAVGRVLAAAES